MADGVDFKDLGIGALKKALKRLSETELTIGYQGPSGAASHPGTDGAPVAQVAAWNEEGTIGAPARPFLAETFDRHEDDLVNSLRKGTAAVIDGRKDVDAALEDVGEAAVKAVRATIDDAGSWAEPLAESTKARKGHGQPLIDTGTLRDSASWAERRGGAIVRQGGKE